MADIQIVIQDGRGVISPLQREAHEAVMKATSFLPSGYQFTRAFQRGRSDGRVKLFKNNRFPAGLLGHVITALDSVKADYDISKEMSEFEKPDIQIEAVDVQAREYQDFAVEAAAMHPRGVIKAPTGAGKTAIGARVIALHGKHALVVVPTIDLLYQYKQFLEEHLKFRTDDGDTWSNKIGQLGDGVVDPRPVTVATIRTAAKALKVSYEKYEFGEYDDKDDTTVNPADLRDWVQNIGTVVVDEAHILGAQTTYDLVTKIPAPYKYGFSASPWRDDGADLMIEAATGPIIYKIGTDELVKGGFLVPPIIRVVNTRGWWIPAQWGQTCQRCKRQRPMTAAGPAKRCECGAENWRSEYQDAYKHEIVENKARNEKIAEIVEELDRPTLVLVKQVNHGKTLAGMIEDSIFLSGVNDGHERTRVYDRVRNGELRTIVCTSIADMGLDLPILAALVLAGGGKSSTRHLQRIGRTARPYPGKNSAIIVDLDDGHVHRWFREHAKARRKIEIEEWGDTALWL